jgi:hypothetical protein
MNELHNDFDDLFRQRFDEFQKDPPENVWNKIQSGIKVAGIGNFSHPLPGSLGYLIYPSVGLLILALLSLLLINSNETANKFSGLNRNINGSLKKSELTLANQNFDNIIVINNNKQISIHETQSLPVNNGIATIDNQNLNKNQTEKTGEVIKNQHSEDLTLIQSDVFEPVNNSEPVIVAQSDPVLELNPIISEIIQQQNNTSGPPNISENQNQTQLPIHDENNLPSNNQTTKDTTLNTNLTQTNNKPDPQHDYGKNANIYIGLKSIPDLSFYNSSGKSHMGYGAELSLGYQFKHFTIQTGAGLMFDKENVNYLADYKTYQATDQYQLVTYYVVDTIPVYQNDSLIGYLYRPTFHTTTVEIFDSVGNKENLTTEIRYTTLNIPFTIGYTWNVKKWGLSLKMGGVYSLMLGKKESEIQLSDPDANITSIDRLNPLRTRQQWSLIFSPSVDYCITHDISVGIEPYFRYTFQSGSNAGKTLGLKPYAMGLKTGITFNF